MGRPRASSVIHCDVDRESIRCGIREALSRGPVNVVNPYGDGHAVERIISVLQQLPSRDTLLLKSFVDQVKADQ